MRGWKIILGIVGGLLLLGFSILFFIWKDLPDPASLKTANPQTTKFIQVHCETQACTLDWVPLEQISPFVIQAVILAEDPRFFEHPGWDFHNLWQAIKINVQTGRPVWGGSTLTMQLAKNLYLTPEKKLARKIREGMLTYKLEKGLNKQRILELYLNVVEMGPNLFGVGHAAKHYFGKTPAQLGPLEAAYLASILPNPQLAEDVLWRQHFAQVGSLIFNQLINFYIPDHDPGDPVTCDTPLQKADQNQVDLIVAKIFSHYANEILTGDADVLSLEQIAHPLTKMERDRLDKFKNKLTPDTDSAVICTRHDAGHPQDLLVPIQQTDSEGYTRTYWVIKDMHASLLAMLAAANAGADLGLGLSSAYRGEGYQLYLFLVRLRRNHYCMLKTLDQVAVSGNSEHECVENGAVDFRDLNDPGVPFARTDGFKWLVAHAHEYGFEMSYPENNAAGYDFEPWHWRVK